LNRNDKRAPEDIDDGDDGESHAADEPTAVWDESALRAAGLTDLFSKRKSEPPPPPATPAAVSADRPSIEVSDDMRPDAATPVAQAPEPEPPRIAEPADPPAPGMGWASTLALAIVLGAIVYALIRYVKG
jgi:hypothetical protein